MNLLFITIRLLDVIDILLVAFLLYQVYTLIRGTVAIKIFLGIFAIYLLWLFVKALNMQLLGSILGQFIGVGVIALIIVFQPELRKGFLLLGSRYFTQNKFKFLRYFQTASSKVASINIIEIVKACRTMSMTKTGALIVFERSIDLRPFVQIKDVLNAETSSRLLVNIFFKNSPLHDGAVIIKGKVLFAARCVLPISEKQIPAEYGMRHLAAVGITELTDAVTIVVSEQTGTISFIKEGQIYVCKDSKELQEKLENDFIVEEVNQSFFGKPD